MPGYVDPSAPPPRQSTAGERFRADPDASVSARVPPGWVRLDALDRNVVAQAAVSNPLLAQLLTEDCCWALAHADWLRRLPGPRQDSSPWQQEGLLLEWKRQRILEVAASLGLRPVPPVHDSR